MLKEEFDEKWKGVIKTYKDWEKYKFEVWDDIEHLEHNKKEQENEKDEDVYCSRSK